MDKTLQDPSAQLTYSKFERPVAESKYIVSVKSKVLNWRNLLYFSNLAIRPASILKTVNGEKYLKDYNFKLLPRFGPLHDSGRRYQKGKQHRRHAAVPTTGTRKRA